MKPRSAGSYVVAAVEAGPLSVAQLTKRLKWSPWRTLQILPLLASLGYVEIRNRLVYLGAGPRPASGTGKARKPKPAPTPAPAPPVEPPAAKPLPPPVAPRGPCPQCGAAGALRRSGRDLYCVKRCGYYLTPGQRRAA